MATTFVNLIAPKQLESSQTTQYTSSGAITIIDKCTVTNTSSANVKLSVNLGSSGGSTSNSNLIIKSKIIQPGETYPCPELVGQILDDFDFISTLAGSASSLTFRVSGRIIT